MVIVINNNLGEGTFIWASGVVYKGEFTYNKIEG